MTFKLGISFAERRFCFIGILISILSATVRAQSTSVQPGSLDQQGSSLCRLRVPRTILQSPANVKEATVTNGALPYAPLSARCKSSLFLSSTDSPYTFASAGLGATWAQATGQWPHYGGGMQSLGEAIWRDSREYRIAEIHSGCCFVDDLASGSSLFSVAPEGTHFSGVVFHNESGGHQK